MSLLRDMTALVEDHDKCADGSHWDETIHRCAKTPDFERTKVRSPQGKAKSAGRRMRQLLTLAATKKWLGSREAGGPQAAAHHDYAMHLGFVGAGS